ncbi:MAG: hypothetical protein HPY69_00295 [Armatimonadetes bacterium]|nr:hypothetical protein [Armatimonadota bacterium]
MGRAYVMMLAVAALGALTSAVPAAPVNDPLVVLSAGVAGALVYVAPTARVREQTAESLEASEVAFRRGFYRGVTPLQVSVPPGEYVVSVALPTEYNMREAMRRAAELTWDGYNQHAIVLDSRTDTWRYAHSYVVKKVPGEPLTVFAAFTPSGTPGQCVVLSPAGGSTVAFTATAEEALAKLDAAGLPGPFADEVADAVMAGKKVLLTTGDTRWAVYAAGRATLDIRRARATGTWSGRRLSVLTPE